MLSVAALRRAAAPAAILLPAAGGAVLAVLAPDRVAALSRQAADLCEAAGPAGWLLLVAAQVAVAASGILPASLFGVLAGALYGPALGFALAAAGTLAGAAVSFALGRAWSRRAGRDRAGPAADARFGAGGLERVDRMIAGAGWRAVCLLRLSPVMPFALTSWALSLSRVSGGAYLGGTLAALPSLLAYVLLGSLGQVGEAGTGTAAGLLQHGLLGLGAAATLLLAVRVRQTLARAVGEPAGIGTDLPGAGLPAA